MFESLEPTFLTALLAALLTALPDEHLCYGHEVTSGLRRPPPPLLAEPRQMALVLTLQQVGFEQLDDIETLGGRQRRGRRGSVTTSQVRR